jgi:ketosteroid isomerase-like protein
MTTGHRNAELARRLWLAIADGDADAIRELFSRTVVLHSYGHNPLSGDYHGPDGVLDYLALAGEESDELKSSLEGVYANDDGAILLFHVSARRGAKMLEMDFLLHLGIHRAKIGSMRVVPMDQHQNDHFWC